MAQEMDDLGFWLPSEFLTDDDLLTDFKIDRSKTGRNDDFSFDFGSFFGFNSDLSSPVESVTGTTETESDEDDLITELSRKVAQSRLQESNLSSDYTAKGLKLSGSPQSTLCGYKPGSRGSPNSASRVCSPPDTKDALRWDMLYAAAEEVARMRMIEQTNAFYSAKPFQPPPKPSPVTVTQQNPNLASRFYPNQTQTQIQARLSYQQVQIAKFQQMKQQQMMENGGWSQEIMDYQLHNGGRNDGVGRPQASSMSAWPALQQSQQQPGSGMRAVFLGETGARKERVGTGVFMPRRFGSNPTETRKKQAACPTVLLPERVVHALNLNLDSVDAHLQRKGNGSFLNEYDAALKLRNNVMFAQQRRSFRPQPAMNQELRLPQDWTY